ncbi:hypothetical protein LUZ60_005948 [Juncus effusus]|nr:hypothetical protein LUZ60_005948 [Juncus effusus]
MRFRNKHFKSGKKCSLPIIIWTLIGSLLLTHLCILLQIQTNPKSEPQVYTNPNFSLTRELESVEEERFHVTPGRSRRNPRAVKRKGAKKPPTIIDEFLDETSDVHVMFFPEQNFGNPKNEGYFCPGSVWLDTDGNPIQAHGGGILYDEKSEVYYWYGENKDGPTYLAHQNGAARVDIIGVSCYSSKDLNSWKNEGIVLKGEERDETHDLHKSNVLERPKVIFNQKTQKYVMWMHIDNSNYSKASVGVATSQNPNGPFEYLYSFRPNNYESRDMTIFKDDDEKAYLIYSSEDNTELHITPLTNDYLNVTSIVKRIFIRKHREAPALFKFNGIYYMVTSGCTGWAPNTAMAHASESVLGPWETLGNPCMGGNEIFRETTYFSQSTFVLPVAGLPAFFIFMADRWNPANLKDSRYVWLPLMVGGLSDEPLEYSFGFALWPRVSIYWHKRWRLPDGWRDI